MICIDRRSLYKIIYTRIQIARDPIKSLGVSKRLAIELGKRFRCSHLGQNPTHRISLFCRLQRIVRYTWQKNNRSGCTNIKRCGCRFFHTGKWRRLHWGSSSSLRERISIWYVGIQKCTILQRKRCAKGGHPLSTLLQLIKKRIPRIRLPTWGDSPFRASTKINTGW